MLQFWRKPVKKTRSNSYSEQCRNINEKQEYHNKYVQNVFNEKYEFFQISEEILQSGNDKKTKSSVAKTLSDVLNEKNALNYFIQYMESKNAEAYLLCWLDIENFKLDLPKNSSLDPHDNFTSSSVSSCTDTDSVISSNSSDFSESSNHEKNNNCDKTGSDISSSQKMSNKEHLTDSALAIFKKYIAQEADFNIKCTNNLRKELIENICDNSKLISKNCFEKVQFYVYKIMENDYFEHFLSSDHYCKYQIDILTSGQTTLDDILSNETALFYFMEYLEQENHRNLLEFWIAATNFQQQLSNQNEFFDPIEAQNDAVVLYDKYFSLQAHCPLYLGDKVRLSLEQTICGENGVNLDCFKLPIAIVERILDKFFMQPFLESQLFYKFLSELINTVQSNGYSTTTNNIKHHERSPSDADSEHSFASSTFLAMEMNHDGHNKKNNVKTKTDMTIDTRELYDPDSLWKHKRKNKLLCGHVTDLGRFETDFEPEPDSGEFNLKKVVRKFVSLEEEQKKKEEMAWQVAEMIVRDITNVTLRNHD